jgi:phospholipid/cholesterol/gamma-HCH transport system substrate-binding protein
MRKAALIAIVVIAVICIMVLFKPTKLWGHRLELRVYFQNAQGIRAGAPVRLAGVDVGSVTNVRPRPDVKGSPAEIVMELNTPYELKVPKDSYVTLQTAGVLGETFAEIDAAGASGLPATSGSVLNAREVQALSTTQLMEKFEKLVQQRCGCRNDTKAVSPSKRR